MSAIPRKRLKPAVAVVRKLDSESSPPIQSWAHISTMPTQTRIPAEKASKVPIPIRVLGSLPLKLRRTAIPINIPRGVMKAKASAIKHLLRRPIVVSSPCEVAWTLVGSTLLAEETPSNKLAVVSLGLCPWQWLYVALFVDIGWPREAILLPRAIPSKNWWKAITMNNVII